MNLVNAWLQAYEGSTEKDEALENLNAALGTNYTRRRLYEWSAGSRPFPARVRDWLILTHLHPILVERGIDITWEQANAVGIAMVELLKTPDNH